MRPTHPKLRSALPAGRLASRRRHHDEQHDIARIRRYAENRVPEHARHQVRNQITVRGGTVTIVEWRAPWRPQDDPEWTSYPVAQLRWNASAATWTLYWRDRHTRWHPYPHTPATTDVNMLLAEIEHNNTGAFWG